MKTYEEILLDFIQTSDDVVVMTAENRAAIRNLPQKIGDRFIDVGICEQTMVGAAAGLALRGRIPVIHALATFLTLRAFEFIRTDIGIGQLPVILVGGVPGFLSDANGPTHQAIEDISLMRGIPGMQVFCPMNQQELTEGLNLLIQSKKPTYIRYYSGLHDLPFSPMTIGKAQVLSEGTEISLLSYGFLMKEVYQAGHILKEKGYSVRIVNMRFLSPIDQDVIIQSLENTSFIFTIEDHFKIGGLFSIVSELFTESNQRIKNKPTIKPIALDNRWFTPALLDRVLDHEGFTAHKLAERILKTIETKSHVK